MSSIDEIALEWWRSLPALHITVREFAKLPEYSATNPTGVIPGKRWKRCNGAHDMRFKQEGGIPRWVICEYQEAEPEKRRVFNVETRVYEDKLIEMCKTVTFRPVVRVKAKCEILCS